MSLLSKKFKIRAKAAGQMDKIPSEIWTTELKQQYSKHLRRMREREMRSLLGTHKSE